MSDELHLVYDGDGITVLGADDTVDAFLRARDWLEGSVRLSTVASVAGAGLQAAAGIAANSGRWFKVTEETAKQIATHGLRESSSGLLTGVIKGNAGQIRGLVEFVPSSVLSNPAVLANVGVFMAQMALQKAIAEVTDFLEAIDAKVDAVLQSQNDNVVAQMIGVAWLIDGALAMRERTGRVDEVTWSKIQAAERDIAYVQAYSLRQLDSAAVALGEKRIGPLADASARAEQQGREWLAVLARCTQLQDALTVLELDRVVQLSPDDIDNHRIGLRAARERRLTQITDGTSALADAARSATERANSKVLLHPFEAPRIVDSAQRTRAAVAQLHGSVGLIEDDRALDRRGWTRALRETRDAATGAVGSGARTAGARIGSATTHVSSASADAAGSLASRARITHQARTASVAGALEKLPRPRRNP